MNTKIVRSRLIPAMVAVATLASVSVPGAAAADAARVGTHSVRVQRSAGMRPPILPIAKPAPRMI